MGVEGCGGVSDGCGGVMKNRKLCRYIIKTLCQCIWGIEYIGYQVK